MAILSQDVAPWVWTVHGRELPYRCLFSSLPIYSRLNTQRFLGAADDGAALEKRRKRVNARQKGPVNYYDQALILFGKGGLDGYRFDAQGRLQPKWRR